MPLRTRPSRMLTPCNHCLAGAAPLTTLFWQGRTWNVDAAQDRAAPVPDGPSNCCTDDRCVYVDDQDRLHLWVRPVGFVDRAGDPERFTCSQVHTQLTTGVKPPLPDSACHARTVLARYQMQCAQNLLLGAYVCAPQVESADRIEYGTTTFVVDNDMDGAHKDTHTVVSLEVRCAQCAHAADDTAA